MMYPDIKCEPVPVFSATGGELRFTLDGDPRLEAHLVRVCARVSGGVARIVPEKKLEAILLGGGYGRGEGGVLRTESGDRPYNDMEFYVFIRGNTLLNERCYGPALHALAHELSEDAGVEVEFKLLSLQQFRRSATTMFSYDLVLGHRWVVGNERRFEGCLHHGLPQAIPLSEVTRLLMNRCSGLLFALERLDRPMFTREDADFTGRNLAKARLALGDAVLAAMGRYHWNCRERARRLAALWDDVSEMEGGIGESDFPAASGLSPSTLPPPTLPETERLRTTGRPIATEEAPVCPPWFADVRDQHVRGIAFKLHPYRATHSRTDLRAELEPLADLAGRVWLWVERRRLQRPFASMTDYANDPADKCPETAKARNLLVNAKHFGPAALPTLAASVRYPRERLLRALPLLLWQPEAPTDPAARRRLQRVLRTRATDFSGFVTAYRHLWERFR